MNRRFLMTGAAVLPVLVLVPRAGRAQAMPDSVAQAKARGKLLAGVKFDTPPFGFLDDSNTPAGFDLDIMRAVGAHIGVPVEFTKVTSVSRVPLLLSGNIDLVAA